MEVLKLRLFWGFLLLQLMVLFIYREVLGFEYVWDDIELFVGTVALRQFDNFTVLFDPILPGTTYFRPVVLFSFMLEFNFIRVDAVISHALNLVFFMIICSLLYFLILKASNFYISKSSYKNTGLIVFFICGFYAFNPNLVEPVAWVSGRFDLLATLFALAAFCGVFIKSRALSYSVIFVCYALALGSKESAFFIPLGVLFFALMKNGYGFGYSGVYRTISNAIFLYLGLVLVAIGYLLVRYILLDKLLHVDGNVSSGNYKERFLLVGLTLKFYLAKIFMPYLNLGPMHPLDKSFFWVDYVVGFLFFIVYLFGVFLYFIRQNRFTFLVSLFFLSLFPVINAFPLTIGGNIGHERFLALPLAIFSIALACVDWARIFETLSRFSRKIFYAISWFVILSFLVLPVVSVTTVPMWSNNITLWSWAYSRHANFYYVTFSLVSSAIRAGELDLAHDIFSEFESAHEIDVLEKSDKYLSLKGHLLQRQGDHEEALVKLTNALHLLGKLPHEYVDLSTDAKLLGKSYDLSWYARFLFGAISESKLAIGDFEGALEAVRIAQFYQSDYPPFFLLESMALLGLGDVESSEYYYQLAISSYVEGDRLSASSIYQSFKEKL